METIEQQKIDSALKEIDNLIIKFESLKKDVMGIGILVAVICFVIVLHLKGLI